MRECGNCSACCRWPAIEEIDKPAKTPCRFLEEAGHGCTIYPDRPAMCAEYKCTWLRGRGVEMDQPSECNVLIDRRMTQFGFMLVAKPLKPGAAMERRGKGAIRRATRDEGLPCLVVDYEDTERIIGVAGPGHLIKEVTNKAASEIIYVGGAKAFIENVVAAAKEGRVMPGVLTNGG